MRLYLVQHGEANIKEEDPERHLSDAGIKNVERIASYISKHIHIKPLEIIHSGKARAEETAKIFEEKIKPPMGIKAMEYLNPMDDPEIWAERAADAKDDLMLVGHLPHLRSLASTLLCGNPENAVVNFQFGGVVCLSKEESGNWAVCWILLPSMID